MNYLSPHQVLFLHARLIEETGGSHGVRDMGLMLSALGRPQATFEDEDLHPTIYEKAAVLADSLINSHPFVDGNKRTGIGAAVLFLSINGYVLTPLTRNSSISPCEWHRRKPRMMKLPLGSKLIQNRSKRTDLS